MATRSDYLFLDRRTARRRWPRLLLTASGFLIATAAALIWALTIVPDPRGISRAGVSSRLDMVAIGDLPGWAREVVLDLALGADYQFRATVVDLNRDEQQEILIGPAPARSDVFVPDSSVRVIRFQDGVWQIDDSGFSCRPDRLGGFLTESWWDISCRNGQGRRLLRWNGTGYRPQPR